MKWSIRWKSINMLHAVNNNFNILKQRTVKLNPAWTVLKIMLKKSNIRNYKLIKLIELNQMEMKWQIDAE